MAHLTYEQIAADFDLWQDRADTYGVYTRDEFHAMSLCDKLRLLIDTFGAESALISDHLAP